MWADVLMFGHLFTEIKEYLLGKCRVEKNQIAPGEQLPDEATFCSNTI